MTFTGYLKKDFKELMIDDWAQWHKDWSRQDVLNHYGTPGFDSLCDLCNGRAKLTFTVTQYDTEYAFEIEDMDYPIPLTAIDVEE